MRGHEPGVGQEKRMRWAVASHGAPREAPPGIDEVVASAAPAIAGHVPVRCSSRTSCAALRHLRTVRTPVVDAAPLARGRPVRSPGHVPARARLIVDDLVAEENRIGFPGHAPITGIAGGFPTPLPDSRRGALGDLGRHDRPRHGRIAMSASGPLGHDVRAPRDGSPRTAELLAEHPRGASTGARYEERSR